MVVSENWKNLLAKGLSTSTTSSTLSSITSSNQSHPPSTNTIEQKLPCTDSDLQEIIEKAVKSQVAHTSTSSKESNLLEISSFNEENNDLEFDPTTEEEDDEEDIFECLAQGKSISSTLPLSTSSSLPSFLSTESRPSSLMGWFAYLNEKANTLVKVDQLGKYIALDCEMVGVGTKGRTPALGRISIVNFHGHVLLDKYVRPKEPIVNYRTKYSGITRGHMKEAIPFSKIHKQIKDLVSQRIIVGHDLRHDLKVLHYFHSKHMLRDTSSYPALMDPFKKKLRPSLKELAQRFLGQEIQSNQHDSVEDARVAMLLYRLHKEEWEDYIQKTITLQSLSKQLSTPLMTPKPQKVTPLSRLSVSSDVSNVTVSTTLSKQKKRKLDWLQKKKAKKQKLD